MTTSVAHGNGRRKLSTIIETINVLLSILATSWSSAGPTINSGMAHKFKWSKKARCTDSYVCIGRRRFSNGRNRPKRHWNSPSISTINTISTVAIRTATSVLCGACKIFETVFRITMIVLAVASTIKVGENGRSSARFASWTTKAVKRSSTSNDTKANIPASRSELNPAYTYMDKNERKSI